MAIGYTFFMHQPSHFKSTPRFAHTIERMADGPTLTGCPFFIVDSAEATAEERETERERLREE